MRSKYLKSFAAAAAVPVIILLLMTVMPLLTMLFGREAVLETESYDPRDLFRGDHVLLNYKIDNVDSSKLTGELAAKLEGKPYSQVENKRLYAVLKEADGFCEVEYVTDRRPTDGIYLNCRLQYYTPGSKLIDLEYNLDKYFVPENTGKKLEELSRSGELTARIKIFNGYAMLMSVSE